MLQPDEPDDYVIATGEEHSVQEFVDIAFAHAGLDWNQHVKTDPAFLRPAEVDHLVGDATKAREQLGWEPRVSFRELVEMMVDADLERLSSTVATSSVVATLVEARATGALMQTDADDILRSPEAGHHVIRGGTIRGLGYGLGVGLTAVASIFLLRYLGVDEFGRYVTVLSLMAIVSGITDAGLTAVGARELALRPRGEPRRQLLENLIGLRLVLTPIGVAAAIVFAIAAGYDSTLVIGTALAGVGLVMINAQATLMLPLSVELRIFQITVAEVLKQAVGCGGDRASSRGRRFAHAVLHRADRGRNRPPRR